MKISYGFTPTFLGAKSLGLTVDKVLWLLQKLLPSFIKTSDAKIDF